MNSGVLMILFNDTYDHTKERLLMMINPADSAQPKPVESQGWLKKAAGKVGNAIEMGVGYVLDEFVPRRQYTSVDINHDNPEYNNISTDEGAKMVGYFTQSMESQGFPWALFKPKKGITKMSSIGEFEALTRLAKGDSVIFQPKRVIGLGFNPPHFKGKDLAGNDVEGKMNVNTGGMEVKFGEPVEIKNMADLKFLYELYNPDIEIDDKSTDKMKSAARELAFFTKGSMLTQYPWKMFKPQSAGRRVIAGTKAAVKSGSKWALVGAAVAYVAKLSSLAVGIGMAGPMGLTVGLAAGAVFGMVKGASSKRHGQEINAFESLSRLSENQPVFFQEQKKKEIGISVPFPVMVELGSLSYFTDHGEGSTINNLDDLKLFHKVQEMEKPPEKPKEGEAAPAEQKK